MQDQPLKPLETAIYWIEFVIRHNGAPHLRSAALRLKWYQREMIDIFAFIVLVLIVMCLFIYVILKKVLTMFLCKKYRKSESKKNR